MFPSTPMDIPFSSALDIHLSISSSGSPSACPFASGGPPRLLPAAPTMPASDQSSASSTETIYFGYGSNLWRQQMLQRCPTSQCLGIARLRNYRWIIYDRGYANVVKIPDDDDDNDDNNNDNKNNGDNDEASASAPSSSPPHDYTREVWGMVYRLQPEDEQRLDRNEGVPREYQKVQLECDFWATEEKQDDGDNSSRNRNLDGITPKKVAMLVYVDHHRTTAGKPKHEYIYRINMGVKDALREGMPARYVKAVVRKFVPDVEDERVAAFAQKQAVDFVDENYSKSK